MENKRITYIVVAAIGIVGIVLFAVLNNQPKRYNWSETFEYEGKQPYDVGIFKTLFAKFFPEKEFYSITDFKRDTSFADKVGANLVYIDGKALIDSTDAARMWAFAEKGNTVFISAANAHELVKMVCAACGEPGERGWIRTRKAKRIKPFITGMRDTTSTLQLHYQVADELVRYPWPYFDVKDCEMKSFKVGGSFEAIENEYTNLLIADVGKGKILLHSTPLLFTNYHLIKLEVLEHVESLLQLLPEGDIYYMEPNFEFARPQNRPLLTESPLRFILGNKALRWAWYGILALALLYVVNTLRRKQRPIAVRIRPENETSIFLDVMSRFYQKEGQHKHIIALQSKMLLSYLRSRYRIKHSIGDEFFAEASVKLQMPETGLKTFFKEIERASFNSSLTEKELVALDQKITEFYAKCP